MRSFKKIAAMIMAVAMLCSFTAFAATVSDFTVADTSTVAPTANVKVESDAAQNTILAYKGTDPVGANVVYIDQLAGSAFTTDGVSFQLGTNAADVGQYTVLVGGTDVAEAKSARFNHTDATPKYDVTLTSADNGTVSYEGSLTQVAENTEIAFTIVPYLGYELSSLMVNDVESVSAVVNGVYTLTVTADTTITPVFAVVAADAGESYTYAEMFDLEAGVEEGDVASKLTFGQATEKADATITSMGMYVQVWSDEANDYVDFYTTGEEHYGPKFAAANWTTDYKYGIRFFGFEQGTYKVWSYVDYSDGASDKGAEIVFTVE